MPGIPPDIERPPAPAGATVRVRRGSHSGDLRSRASGRPVRGRGTRATPMARSPAGHRRRTALVRARPRPRTQSAPSRSLPRALRLRIRTQGPRTAAGNRSIRRGDDSSLGGGHIILREPVALEENRYVATDDIARLEARRRSYRPSQGRVSAANRVAASSTAIARENK